MTHALLAVLALHSLVPATSPYQVSYVGDGAITAGSLGVVALFKSAWSSLPGGISCRLVLENGRCDPAQLNALDRKVIGNDSHAWTVVSDVGAGASYALPLLLDAVDVFSVPGEHRGDEYARDVTVMAESVAVATLFTHALKYAVRRPRPTQYRDAFVGTVEHQLSFPSGHTSSASAAAAAYVTTFALRHPDSPWRWAVGAGAAAITGLTAYGRIGGGWHFYSDVLAGALVGATAGIAIPLFHQRGVQVEVSSRVAEGSMPARFLAGLSFAI